MSNFVLGGRVYLEEVFKNKTKREKVVRALTRIMKEDRNFAVE